VLAVKLVVAPDQGGDRGSLVAVQAAGRVPIRASRWKRRKPGRTCWSGTEGPGELRSGETIPGA